MKNGAITTKQLNDDIASLHHNLSDVRASSKKRGADPGISDDTTDILDAISYCVTIINITGEILHINEAAARLFACRKEEVIGGIFTELFLAERDIPKFHKILTSLHSRDFANSILFTSKHQDGMEFPSIISLSAVKDADGFPVRVVVIHRDMSEFNPALRERERLQNRLIQTRNMEIVGMLACGIAHDFSKIVTAINNFSHLGMKQFEKSSPQAYDIFANIKTASCRATNLLRQLLTIGHSRPSTHTVVDMNKVINNLLQMLFCVIREDIKLKLDLEQNLLMTMGDSGKMEQVIINLVVNARDAMPDGGEITIKTENVTLNNVEKFVRLIIKDTGTGIGKENIKHIFDPFFTTKKSGDSVGIGLSVVYDVIDGYGGWINVISEEGKGAVFEILLPAFDNV